MKMDLPPHFKSSNNKILLILDANCHRSVYRDVKQIVYKRLMIEDPTIIINPNPELLKQIEEVLLSDCYTDYNTNTTSYNVSNQLILEAYHLISNKPLHDHRPL